MQKNVGGLDEGIRITLGPLLVVLSIASLQGTVRLRPAVTAGAFAVGAVLTVTGLTQTCPANSAMGRNTYRPTEKLGEEARAVRQRALQ
ncbi:DUF2892 domain-containing protein [Halorussus gelatinilyticus]|uniref:DUF2892 domain-containing protein n=1 Tax=Halorussus gelatinilyticus TaxID=2937524 RepID=A0A8U0IIW6_9EURY|nr:DUF2892 domain-containing protein [Halorussus gelatinilyticus]UPW00635.1 DUF2892 domain-containing protein [Halorussus gelatinilyticus]